MRSRLPIFSLRAAAAFISGGLVFLSAGRFAHAEASVPRFLAATAFAGAVMVAALAVRPRADSSENVSGSLPAAREADEDRLRNETRSEELRAVNADLLETRSALMNVLEDVEESRRLIEIEERRLAAIVEAVGDGLLAAGPDRRVYLCNPAAGRLLGLDPARVIGLPLEDAARLFRDGDDALQVKEIADAFLGRGSRLPGRLSFVRADGSRLPVSGTVMPVRDELDRLSGVVLAVRDVTLEREIDRQKSNFIAIASHQLRTPISAIRWYLDLLLAGEAGALQPTQREYLADVHASVLRMNRLVGDLLNVSRIESGKLPLVTREVPAAAFIRGVIAEHRPLMEGKRIVFEESVPEELPAVSIDPSLSAQALGNVLSNAIKYTPVGGHVAVTARAEGSAVTVEVADSGLGISEGDRHHLYEKFWRGEKALLQETAGTGIGLYLTKTVLDQTGASIRFESEEGRGSRFFVTFPVSPDGRGGKQA